MDGIVSNEINDLGFIEPSRGHMLNLPTLILKTNVDCSKMSESWGLKIIYAFNLIFKKVSCYSTCTIDYILQNSINVMKNTFFVYEVAYSSK